MKRCSANGCSNQYLARGYCAKHYWRVVKYGSIELPRIAKFWANVYPLPSGCLEWSGARPNSYGRTSFAGCRGLTHRIAYELTYGRIPDGLLVLHRCDNPPCINPDHLFLGTDNDNVQDKVSKQRHRFKENHPLSKLTQEQVDEIRARYKVGGIYQKELAANYEVGEAQISRIIRNERWVE